MTASASKRASGSIFWGRRSQRRRTSPKRASSVRAILADPTKPQLGRFLSRDPIGFRGGLNMYNYAKSNPARYIDPRGLQTNSTTQYPNNGPTSAQYGYDYSAYEIFSDEELLGMGQMLAIELGLGVLMGGGFVKCSWCQCPNPSSAVMGTLSGAETSDQIVDTMKAMAWENGQEVGLVRLQGGARAIVMGTEETNITLPIDTSRLIGHLHPMDLPAAGPSLDDITALFKFNQYSSLLYERGTWCRFSRTGRSL